MQLKPKTEKALAAWLGPDTWHKIHDDDMDRWYDFVNQYQQDHGYEIDEAALREHIAARVRGDGYVSDDLIEVIKDRISLAYTILDFLKRTGR